MWPELGFRHKRPRDKGERTSTEEGQCGEDCVVSQDLGQVPQWDHTHHRTANLRPI